MKKVLILIVLVFSVVLSCFAYKQLKFTGGVFDNANVLKPEDKQKIESIVKELYEKTDAVLVVKTVNLNGEETIKKEVLKTRKSYKTVNDKMVIILVDANSVDGVIEADKAYEKYFVTAGASERLINNTIKHPSNKKENLSSAISILVVMTADIIAVDDKGIYLESTQLPAQLY